MADTTSPMPGLNDDEFAALEGGRVTVGTETPEIAGDGEGPPRKTLLHPFKIAKHAVTNARFEAFVRDTGYITDAERFGWSYVFHMLLPPEREFAAAAEAPWWRVVEGACWRRPEAGDSAVESRPDHPVVHVSWNDARAYAEWAGGRLPSEAEWEFAARGGLEGGRFPWGEEEPDDETVVKCNIWQGPFPTRNTLLDGYLGTAPVASFEPNGYGLYNMAGNVWEWCADPFLVRSLTRRAKERNRQARAQGERVVKGGSYLCHKSYCYRYRIAARSGRSPDTSAGNTGFRIVFDNR